MAIRRSGVAVLVLTAAICGCTGVTPRASVEFVLIVTPEPQAVEQPPASGATAADYMQLGRDLANQGRFDEAIAAYDKAIELDPTNAEAYLRRADLKNVPADPRQSLADYDRAIELDPTNAEAFYWRAIAKERAAKVGVGSIEDAIPDLDRALALATDPALIANIKRYRCLVGLGCEP